MSRKVKVPVIGTVNRVIQINPDATPGAVFGENLVWPDGRVVRLQDFAQLFAGAGASVSDDGGSGGAPIVWGFIEERPANINQAAGVTGVGLVTRRANGTWVTRVLNGTAGRIEVSDSSGDDASPQVDLAEVAVDLGGDPVAITIDAYGRVVEARPLGPGDIPTLPAGSVIRAPADGNSSLTLELGDESRIFIKTDEDPYTYTLPDNATEAFPEGSVIEVVNAAGTENITIERAVGVELLWIGGGGVDDDRDVEPWGKARLIKISEDTWLIEGEGIV